MIRVIWQFQKDYKDEEFVKLFSESNDLMKEGYQVIAKDFDSADSMDDLNLDYFIEDYSDN